MPENILTFLSNVSDKIIAIAAFIAATFVIIDKLILPITKKGKLRAENKKKEQEENISKICQYAIEKNNSKIRENFDEVNETLKVLTEQVTCMVKLNAEQNGTLDLLDAKIDENEVGRLRWEILDFANSLRSGANRTIDDFRHINEQYDKYESILTRLGRENGAITLEKQFIDQEYLKIKN